jgi:hypothetical protein
MRHPISKYFYVRPSGRSRNQRQAVAHFCADLAGESSVTVSGWLILH